MLHHAWQDRHFGGRRQHRCLRHIQSCLALPAPSFTFKPLSQCGRLPLTQLAMSHTKDQQQPPLPLLVWPTNLLLIGTCSCLRRLQLQNMCYASQFRLLGFQRACNRFTHVYMRVPGWPPVGYVTKLVTGLNPTFRTDLCSSLRSWAHIEASSSVLGLRREGLPSAVQSWERLTPSPYRSHIATGKGPRSYAFKCLMTRRKRPANLPPPAVPADEAPALVYVADRYVIAAHALLVYLVALCQWCRAYWED